MGPAQRAKRALVEALCSSPVAAAIDAVTSRRPPSHGGLRIDLAAEEVPSRVRAAVFWRRYERQEVSLIRRHLPRDLDVIELGAGFGITGAHILDVISSTSRLIAVEANPASLSVLARTLRDPRAVIVHAAVDYRGTGDYSQFVLRQSRLGSRVSDEAGLLQQEIAVPRITLSDLVRTHRVGAFALVADIEGAECEMVFQDAGSLSDCRAMILETHGYRDSLASREEVLERLKELGFRILDRAEKTFALTR